MPLARDRRFSRFLSQGVASSDGQDPTFRLCTICSAPAYHSSKDIFNS
jgi:hypothetical protein